MLHGMTWASPPNLMMPSATASQASALRLEITTLAPSLAISSAEARPMPRLEPVMTATLPVRSNGGFFIVISFLGVIDVPRRSAATSGAASPFIPDIAALIRATKLIYRVRRCEERSDEAIQSLLLLWI